MSQPRCARQGCHARPLEGNTLCLEHFRESLRDKHFESKQAPWPGTKPVKSEPPKP